ncbi:MAG: hypothetical protein JWL59_2746 [Chthoniobacteraceae bacterium]|nr:hypothetical protein [Chthoniobacteraceae bacterium]
MIMRLLRLCIFTVILFAFALPVQARDQKENVRIESLVKTLEGLKGAKFIRNGSEYGASEAGSHLRMKLAKAGDKVKTAEDFIQLCASQSYLSGKKYQIKMSDGKVVEAGAYLTARLKENDAK